ncbi:hypothetical protein TNCV_1378471 [Trichonephila clavipes]|nr:hypothetical protein TNCV_1378471 [Trichonephila clavipes]
MHLIVQVVRQGVVIQSPEMGQHFQVDCKKSQLFTNFPLVRSLDDDEASVSLGQVTKLAPDAERHVFQEQRSGRRRREGDERERGARRWMEKKEKPCPGFRKHERRALLYTTLQYRNFVAPFRMQLIKLIRSLYHQQAPVASDQLTKLSPHAKGQWLAACLIYARGAWRQMASQWPKPFHASAARVFRKPGFKVRDPQCAKGRCRLDASPNPPTKSTISRTRLRLKCSL